MTRVEYIQLLSLNELTNAVDMLDDDTTVLAGGTDLLLEIRNDPQKYSRIVSLCMIPELKKIEKIDSWLKIGATATHASIVENSLVGRYFTALRMACAHVGSQQIRNKGTIGGNIMNASPAGDMAPCLFLFGAEIEMLTKCGAKRMPIEDFITSDGRLVEKGILTAIWLPIDSALRSCFIKLGTRREVTIAQISLCASWKMKGAKREMARVCAGAIDIRPYILLEPQLMASLDTADAAAEHLSAKIREIRMSRKRPPKLKITEAEQRYKERAVKGVVYDVIKTMENIDTYVQETEK